MRSGERGAATNLIVGLVVLVVAALAVFYFVSDPFRTKTDTTIRGLTEWTPENIAEDPINYLNFCEAEAKKALKKLEAAKISIAQRRAKLVDMKATGESKVAAGEQALTECKAAYIKADAADSFPIEWKGRSYSREEMQAQIVSFYDETEAQRSLLRQVEKGLVQLDAQEKRRAKQKEECQRQLTQIATNREMLKVQEISDALTEQLVNMKGMLAATISVSEESTDLLTLEDLAAEAADSADEGRFEEIMSK